MSCTLQVLILDLSCLETSYSDFKDGEDWKPFQGDVEEVLPPNAPEPVVRVSLLVCLLTLTTQWTERTEVLEHVGL